MIEVQQLKRDGSSRVQLSSLESNLLSGWPFMLNLLKGSRIVPFRLPSRNYTIKSLFENVKPQKGDQTYLDPDWFRTPQESDGPRGINPDYPETPYISHQARSPYQAYDDSQLKRNFGETLNEDYDVLTSQSFDIETTYSMRYMLTGVAVAGATVFGAVQFINLFDDKNGWRRPTVLNCGCILLNNYAA